MKRAAAISAGTLSVALLAGCGAQGVYGVPLPGGASTGDKPLHLTVQFEDVLDLVPQSAVRVNDVTVGRVETIEVPNQGWTADVKVVLNSSADLPANAIARVDQTSLLGEKYVELQAPPEGPSPNKMADGATIPLNRTSRTTQIEEVLGALSLLLNGGGVAQVQPVVHELTQALDGRAPKVRGLLEDANRLIDGLNQQKDDITKALDGLDVLTSRVNEQNDKIGQILDQIPVAVGVLEEQRPELTRLLAQLDRLGQVGTDVINRSKDNLIADLRALRPTLQALGAAAPDLVKSLSFVPTLPFPDGIEKAIHGNSLNLFISLDTQISDQLNALGVGQGDPRYIQPPYGQQPVVDPSNPYYNGNGPRPGWPTVSLLPLPPITAQGTATQNANSPNPVGDLLNRLGMGGR